MNTSLLFLSVCLLLVQQIAAHGCDSGSGNTCEAETRKKDCGGLVEEPDDSGEEASSPAPASVPTPPPGECICTPAPGSGSGSGEFHSHCPLVEFFYNISITLTVEQQTIFIEWIRHIEITILADFSLTNEQKIVAIAYELKAFFELHYEIEIAIGYELILDWGYVVDLISVAIDIQSDYVGSLIILDGEDDCDLFEGLRNATEGDSEKYAAVLILIEELKVILIDVSLTYEAKLTLIYEKFEAFFELHAEWESFFLDIEFFGFGTLEQFIDVTLVYWRITNVSIVIGGSSSECVLIQALEEAFQNTSFSLSVRSQIQQIKVKVEGYFASETNVYLRLEYISAQLYQFFKLDIKIVKYVKRITLGEWGSIYDLLFCAGFFGEHGWNFGLTSEAPETTVATTTDGAGSGCSERGGLITIDFSSNTTVLTSSVNTAYATWTRNEKANFASYKKRIETIIWGVEFSSVESKLTQITTVFTGYAPAGTTSYTLVMNIEITGWGTVQQFCDCQN
ncbi:hypothetical protein AAVH_16346 [Aphelenchoides avenae]|nr:hypothetical protein AAVH_16346 [Aphelenchus avenae]